MMWLQEEENVHRALAFDNQLGLTQTTDFLSFVGYFSLCRAKNNLQKKKSTTLPQATAAFA
jgi:hypothetical protein